MGERYVGVGKVRSRSGALRAGALMRRVLRPPSGLRRCSEAPRGTGPTGEDGSHALLRRSAVLDAVGIGVILRFYGEGGVGVKSAQEPLSATAQRHQ